MFASMWFATAFAEDCARVPVAEQTLELAGATGLVVRGVEGAVDVIGDDGTAVRATGTACADGVQVKLVQKAGVVYATVKGAHEAGLELHLAVPRSLAALTVQDQAGAFTVRDLPARFAAVSSNGPIEVHGVQSVRLAYTVGAFAADDVRGDVVVDHLTGPLSAKSVGGDVTVDAVVGPVAVDDVGGNLAVSGTGAVSQSNVRGSVLLP